MSNVKRGSVGVEISYVGNYNFVVAMYQGFLLIITVYVIENEAVHCQFNHEKEQYNQKQNILICNPILL